MSSCMTCGGLIMEPNKAYGYAGPVCRCIPTPRYQQRSDQQQNVGGMGQPNISMAAFAYKIEEIIARLERIEKSISPNKTDTK
jgi:hypothetical protein